jgi:serine phosphatase RsbU (regulator of sigma subunit)
LNILSIDMGTKTLVATRNNPAPALLINGGERIVLDQVSNPIGLYRATRPIITEITLSESLTACVFTDGLVHAGDRYGQPIDTPDIFFELAGDLNFSPQKIADRLLQSAVTLDKGRPTDDISVVVLKVVSIPESDAVRRMNVRLPLMD